MDENASDALLLAGGILIGILVLTFAVFTFQSTAQFAKSYYDDSSANELAMFNNKFEIYNRDDLTIQDIVTLANLAREINDKNYIDTANTETDKYAIQIILKYDTNPAVHLERMKSDELYKEILSKNEYLFSVPMVPAEFKKYKCKTIEYNENTQKVNKMIFVTV